MKVCLVEIYDNGGIMDCHGIPDWEEQYTTIVDLYLDGWRFKAMVRMSDGRSYGIMLMEKEGV